jgi:hypothetical protein
MAKAFEQPTILDETINAQARWMNYCPYMRQRILENPTNSVNLCLLTDNPEPSEVIFEGVTTRGRASHWDDGIV